VSSDQASDASRQEVAGLGEGSPSAVGHGHDEFFIDHRPEVFSGSVMDVFDRRLRALPMIDNFIRASLAIEVGRVITGHCLVTVVVGIVPGKSLPDPIFL
jgi:hypothetical protein